jgi:ELWxxDGT repeat protein
VTVLSAGLDLALSGGRVFFAGQDSQYGSQPWVTGGTRAGTRLVTALPGHGGSSDPKELTAFGGRLLFTADDGTGTSFWLADGAGASPVPGTAGIPNPMDVTVAGGLAYFLSGTSELWRTDGTAPGTLRLASFPDQTLSDLRDFGGRLLFLAGPPTPAFWASDGTAAGTAKLFDLPAGTSKVSDVTVLGAELYFAAEIGTRPRLFRSDGTGIGTLPILDLPCSVNANCTGPYLPLHYTRLEDHVYFTAYTSGNGFSGPALWRTDGTAAGTVRVLPAPDRTGVLRVFFPDHLFAFGGDLYFFANMAGNATHKVLFRGRDEAGAVRLSSWGSEPFRQFEPEWTPVGNTLFFRTWDVDHGMELWKTDGTPEGTVLVKDILPGLAASDPRDLTPAGNLLFFSARDAAHGRELWVTDGTEAGTRLVQDLFPGGLSSDPEQLTLVGGRLHFTADDGVVGRELWSLVVP